MQLISIGDAIINLDRVTVIDVDREGGLLRLKVHGDSAEPIIAFNRVGQEVIAGLFNLIPQQMRFRGVEEP